jgi:carboxyl-terminal processing protease
MKLRPPPATVVARLWSSTRTALAVCVGVALGVSMSVSPDVVAEKPVGQLALPWDDARMLSDVLARIKRDYVDEVDEHKLMQSAIKGMVSSLDSHSTFLEPADYENVRVNTTGAYSGIGLELETVDGRVRVLDPVDGSPAQRAGVRTGDWLVGVDGRKPDPKDLQDTVKRLRGRAGTLVTLAVERDGEARPLTLEVRRGQVQLHTVRAEMLDEGYGYVRINHFSDTTAADLERAVEQLRTEAGGPLKGLVLDLRNNPGGVLEAGIDVADAFLDSGTIVSASGRAADSRFLMKAAPGDLLDGAKLTLLVNGGSASSSEIVAGALRDNHRATIVGRTTYGKGSVQTVMPLTAGRALKITTSRYYTPSGESINEKGIRPDVVVPRDMVKVEPASIDSRRQPAIRDPEVALALDTTKGVGAQEPTLVQAGSPVSASLRPDGRPIAQTPTDPTPTDSNPASRDSGSDQHSAARP